MSLTRPSARWAGGFKWLTPFRRPPEGVRAFDDRGSYRRRLRRITAAPCPFGSAYVAERCGQSSATLSDHVFPESVWKAFGEHVGGERGSGGEGGTRKKRRRPLGSLLGHSWGLLGASWGPLGGLLGASLGLLGASGGFLEASLIVLRRSWPV